MAKRRKRVYLETDEASIARRRLVDFVSQHSAHKFSLESFDFEDRNRLFLSEPVKFSGQRVANFVAPSEMNFDTNPFGTLSFLEMVADEIDQTLSCPRVSFCLVTDLAPEVILILFALRQSLNRYLHSGLEIIDWQSPVSTRIRALLHHNNIGESIGLSFPTDRSLLRTQFRAPDIQIHSSEAIKGRGVQTKFTYNKVLDSIKSAALKANIPPSIRFELNTAVVEAILNSAQHAYADYTPGNAALRKFGGIWVAVVVESDITVGNGVLSVSVLDLGSTIPVTISNGNLSLYNLESSFLASARREDDIKIIKRMMSSNLSRLGTSNRGYGFRDFLAVANNSRNVIFQLISRGAQLRYRGRGDYNLFDTGISFPGTLVSWAVNY